MRALVLTIVCVTALLLAVIRESGRNVRLMMQLEWAGKARHERPSLRIVPLPPVAEEERL